MALAHSFYRVNIDFTESSGKSVRRTYRMNPAVVTSDTLAAAAAADIVALVKVLTDSVVNQYQWESVFFDSNALPANAENSDQALITAKLTGKPNQSGELSIPAANIDLFVSPTGAGRDVVNTANTDFLDWLGNWLPGGTMVISDGDTIVDGTEAGRRRNVHSLGT
ncbi:MAG TPA: hypothetical protein VLK33_22545 [Terriglobales bacterium]|nr:hypothetical protein [Terriglobales bacterium]